MSKTALQKAQGEAQRKARKQRDFSKVFTLPNVSQQTPVQTAPDGLKLQLFGYQLRSLSRMCGIEGDGMISLPTGSSGSAECHFRGGVIADVVGMGKTAQLIALFLARPYGEQDRLNGRRGNLVITPGHLCTQWAEEVAKFAGSALSVKIVDPERAPPSSVNLQNFDVVITSLEYISGAGYQELYGHWKRIVYDECHEVRAPRWAGNCHFRLLSALHAHTTTPYKTDLLWETLRALNRPGRARTAALSDASACAQHALPRAQVIAQSSTEHLEIFERLCTAVRAAEGRLSALRVFHRKSILYGGFCMGAQGA
jgi:hypothetical protein